MELYILNPNLEILGIIDDYDDLLWTRSFTKPGNIELELVPFEGALELLVEDNILLKNDESLEAGYIEHIAITKDDEGKEKLQIKGRELKGYTNRRITLRNQTCKGTVEDVMREYVDTNMVNPTNVNRKIPLVTLPLTESKGPQIEYNAHYKELDSVLEDLAETYGLGYNLLISLEEGNIQFKVVEGKDRTLSQEVNEPVQFSEELENLDSYDYLRNSQDHKNTVLVAGAGEGASRKTLLLGDEQTGLNRKELFVDARDIEDTKTSGDTEVPIPTEEYNKLLQARGESKLAEHKIIECFQGEVINTDTLSYRVDFDLGDIVTITDLNKGIILDTRICTIVEHYSSGGLMNMDIQFGNDIPNPLVKLKRRMI